MSPRRQLVPLFALVLAAALPVNSAAQRITPAGVTLLDRPVSTAAAVTAFASFSSAEAPAAAQRRSMRPFLIGGALAGAVIGALLATSFHDSFCGEPAPGYSCSTTSPVAGAMVGAGIGLFAGWLVWGLTEPRGSSTPTRN